MANRLSSPVSEFDFHTQYAKTFLYVYTFFILKVMYIVFFYHVFIVSDNGEMRSTITFKSINVQLHHGSISVSMMMEQIGDEDIWGLSSPVGKKKTKHKSFD